MEGFEQAADIYAIGAIAAGEFSLEDGYVCGVSVENDVTSANDLQVSLNGSIWLPCRAGDAARKFGGFEACNVPGHLKGILKYKFASTNVGANIGYVIITRITTSKKKIE